MLGEMEEGKKKKRRYIIVIDLKRVVKFVLALLAVLLGTLIEIMIILWLIDMLGW